jgi:hypothetical protein
MEHCFTFQGLFRNFPVRSTGKGIFSFFVCKPFCRVMAEESNRFFKEKLVCQVWLGKTLLLKRLKHTPMYNYGSSGFTNIRIIFLYIHECTIASIRILFTLVHLWMHALLLYRTSNQGSERLGDVCSSIMKVTGLNQNLGSPFCSVSH